MKYTLRKVSQEIQYTKRYLKKKNTPKKLEQAGEETYKQLQ